MNTKFAILGISALAVTGLFIASTKAYAYRGDPTVQGPYHTDERHTAMTEAFENNDYNAWKELMDGKGRVTEVITEENFARFAEAHRLAQEGNMEEARQIRQELGLQNGNMHRGGQGNGQGWNR